MSTALDPAALSDPTPINRVATTGDAACGFIPFNADALLPHLDDPRHAQRLFHDDELPVQYFRDPSYDAATGAFSLGQGVGGNVGYWSLRDRCATVCWPGHPSAARPTRSTSWRSKPWRQDGSR